MTRNFFVCLPSGYLFENLKISTGQDLCRFALQAPYSVPKSRAENRQPLGHTPHRTDDGL